MQTIEQIQTAVVAAFPQATPQEQGKAIAAIIESLGIEQSDRRTRTASPKAPRTRKPKAATPKTAPKAEKPATIERKPNHAGVMMLAGRATITKGQIRNITGIAERNGEPFTKAELADIAQYSMVQASDFYAGLKADYSA